MIVCADLHVHPYKLCSRDGGGDRLRDGLSALRQTLDMARQRACPWVFCGDMKTPKTSWPQEALTGALEIVEEYPDVPKLMLPGNHDGDASHLGGSGLAPFRTCARVVEIPALVEWAGMTVAVAPWHAHHDIAALIAEARQAKVRVLLGHGFFAGVFLGPDDVRLPGKGWALADFGIGDTFDVAVFGDVHKGQRLTRPRARPPAWVSWADLLGPAPSSPLTVRPAGAWTGEVVYPGSPYQQTWGERGDGPKGAVDIDLTTGTVTLLPVSAPRFREIELSGLRFDAMERLLLDASAWEDDFVRLVIPDGIVTGARGFVEKLRDTAHARDFQVVVRRTTVTERRAEIRTSMSSRDLLSAYLAARPLDGADVTQTLTAGLRLLEDP